MLLRNPVDYEDDDDGDGDDNGDDNALVMTMHRWNNLWHAKASLGRVGGGGAAVVDWVVRVRQLSSVILFQV